MALPIEEISAAWRALSGHSEVEGWRSIHVNSTGPCTLMAARHFPGNEEALLVGFTKAKIPSADKLPSGYGFSVTRINLHENTDNTSWLAVSRHESGNLELFAAMISDVVNSIVAVSDRDEDLVLKAILWRIRAWQEFMRKGAQPLGLEAEIGLIGELLFLSILMKEGFPPHLAVEAWEGPLHGIQDFIIGTGAVEVKATLSTSGFPAKIGSLEQLDDSIRQPLFVAGVRLSQTATGLNLPDFVEAVLKNLRADNAAENLFTNKIITAGYIDAHSDFYPRRFSLIDKRFVEVVDGFPRIIPGTAPHGVRKASYEIDLDRAAGRSLETVEILNKLGAL